MLSIEVRLLESGEYEVIVPDADGAGDHARVRGRDVLRALYAAVEPVEDVIAEMNHFAL